MVYASEHAALAVLETLVHVSPRDLPMLRLAEATLPDRLVHRVEAAALPAGWDAYPHVPASQTFGDEWLDEARHAALAVPSSLVPGVNILLNPRHASFTELVPQAVALEIPFARRRAAGA